MIRISLLLRYLIILLRLFWTFMFSVYASKLDYTVSSRILWLLVREGPSIFVKGFCMNVTLWFIPIVYVINSNVILRQIQGLFTSSPVEPPNSHPLKNCIIHTCRLWRKRLSHCHFTWWWPRGQVVEFPCKSIVSRFPRRCVNLKSSLIFIVRYFLFIYLPVQTWRLMAAFLSPTIECRETRPTA